MTKPDGLRVTKLARNPDGYWTANASLDGATIHADTSAGPWCVRPAYYPDASHALRRGVTVREVRLAIRLELVRQQRRAERREAASSEQTPTEGGTQ